MFILDFDLFHWLSYCFLAGLLYGIYETEFK